MPTEPRRCATLVTNETCYRVILLSKIVLHPVFKRLVMKADLREIMREAGFTSPQDAAELLYKEIESTVINNQNLTGSKPNVFLPSLKPSPTQTL